MFRTIVYKSTICQNVTVVPAIKFPDLKAVEFLFLHATIKPAQVLMKTGENFMCLTAGHFHLVLTKLDYITNSRINSCVLFRNKTTMSFTHKFFKSRYLLSNTHRISELAEMDQKKNDETAAEDTKEVQRTRSEKKSAILCGRKRKSTTSEVFKPIDPNTLSLTERAYFLRNKYLHENGKL